MLYAEVALPVPIFGTFHYTVPDAMRAAIGRGSRVRAPFGPKLLSGVVLRLSETAPVVAGRTINFRPLDSLVDAEPLLTDELMDLALWLSERYLCPLGEAVSAVFPLYLKTGGRPEPPAAPELPAAPREAFELTPSQDAALGQLSGMLDARKFAPALLFGLPASGKTEVYLRLAERALDAGGQVLFLVPEISLTPPFIEEFRARLKRPLVVWHSRMPEAAKRRSWLALARGERHVVIGARSAALLPFRDLRLAVLDEEQDESYKQDTPSPHYHAREVLLERAKRHEALLVMGSATPSLEALHAAHEGRWAMVQLSDRVSEQKELPRVMVEDRKAMKREFLGPRLVELVKDRLAKKEQVILLVNRRGFATFLMCRACGWVARCKSCGTALIHHRVDGGKLLRCHHCSFKQQTPEKCPKCSHPGPLHEGGAGTQRVVQALKHDFPEARVLQLDRDTVKGKDHGEDLYRRFKSGDADIFVGTKLISKGFHFPEVTLVGVVDADTPLNLPDFRAAEKTFQLLFQAAGRAGRAKKEGLVVVQSSQPEHYVIDALMARDYHAFAKTELAYRKDLNYPPYSHLARVLFLAVKEEKALEAAEKAAEALRNAALPDTEILGPSPGAYAKMRGRFRHQLLLKCADYRQFRAAFDVLKKTELPPSARWGFQVDPLDIF